MATQFTLQGAKPMLGNANMRINTTAMQGKPLGVPLLKVCIILECSRRQLVLIASFFNEIYPSYTPTGQQGSFQQDQIRKTVLEAQQHCARYVSG